MHAQVGPPCCTLPPPLPPIIPPPPPPPPIIPIFIPPAPTCTLSVSATSFSYGGGNSTLSWTASHASSASINGGVGSVSATAGSKQIHVSTTGTYVLSVANSSGKATCDAKITVAPPPTPKPTCTLSASPSSIQRGSSSTLSWTTTHASSFTINQGIGAVAHTASGATTTSPTNTTTYAGTASGAGGTVTCGTKVVVVQPPPPSPTSFTITATKIICKKESDLPNWSGTGHSITKTTATDYVATHSDCHLASGWTFEWAPGGTPNPGNEELTGGSAWTSFGTTTSAGTVTTTIKKVITGRVWVREDFKPGYIPFTGDAPHASNVSAELYCNTDVLNYDNYDAVVHPKASHAYYCAAWNVLKKQTPPPPPTPTPKPTCTLSASPSSIQRGSSSTLSWTTTHASSFTINQGIGAVAHTASGATTTSPTNTTTYAGTASGAGGTVTCGATVTVTHGGGGGGGPMCVLFVAPKVISSGASSTLSWGGSGIKTIFINNGIGTTTGTNGSVSVGGAVGTHTYTGTFTAFSGQKLKCSSTLTVTGGGGGVLPPAITLAYFRKSPPLHPLAMVYLSQFPSTGLYLGTVGTIVYWFILIVWSVALAYALLFIVAPFLKRRARTFGAQVRAVLNAQPTSQNEPPAPSHIETFTQSSGAVENRQTRSSHDGFKSFAQHDALSVDDIVHGLSRTEQKYNALGDIAPMSVQQSVETTQSSAHPVTNDVDMTSALSGILSTQTMTRQKDIQNQAPVESLIHVAPHIEEQQLVQTNETDVSGTASTRGFVAALLEGDRTAVFYALRQVARGGGDTTRFLADATCMLDDAFRSRVDGTECDPDVARLSAKYQTPVLEEIITSLATAIDASYSSNTTAAKLALTRALSHIGA